MQAELFSKYLLEWWDVHGRKDLPWQQNQTPYRVWISEIMLQQTQVKTVIPYYQRFMERFPDVHSLAAAQEDEVLHLWTGLGYYARARNLHKAAKKVSTDYHGIFPDSVDGLQDLPGIGRSTAGAIAAFSMGRSTAIMDGNVKRVLCRTEGIREWPGTKPWQDRLWELAEERTPSKRTGDYNQAMMDLGATLCTRSRPACPLCPFTESCVAYNQGLTSQIPAPKPRKEKPVRSAVLMMLQQPDGRIMLEKRPAQGIWGGLYSFPQFDDHSAAENWLATNRLKVDMHSWAPFRHTFSHYHLDIQPLLVELKSTWNRIAEDDTLWLQPVAEELSIGLAAPVKLLLEKIEAGR